MRARIFNAVTRFQAIWRGYIYKKAYPLVRLDAIATRILNEAGLQDESTISSTQEDHDIFHPSREAEFWEQWDQSTIAAAHRRKFLWSGEGGNEQEKEQEDTVAQNARKRQVFLHQNTLGAHMEVLMDEKQESASIYSAKVIKIQGVPEIDGLYYWVKYHHDDEVRKYHWKRLLLLKRECEAFKSKHNILTPIVGKLPVYTFLRHRH